MPIDTTVKYIVIFMYSRSKEYTHGLNVLLWAAKAFRFVVDDENLLRVSLPSQPSVEHVYHSSRTVCYYLYDAPRGFRIYNPAPDMLFTAFKKINNSNDIHLFELLDKLKETNPEFFESREHAFWLGRAISARMNANALNALRNWCCEANYPSMLDLFLESRSTVYMKNCMMEMLKLGNLDGLLWLLANYPERFKLLVNENYSGFMAAAAVNITVFEWVFIFATQSLGLTQGHFDELSDILECMNDEVIRFMIRKLDISALKDPLIHYALLFQYAAGTTDGFNILIKIFGTLEEVIKIARKFETKTLVRILREVNTEDFLEVLLDDDNDIDISGIKYTLHGAATDGHLTTIKHILTKNDRILSNDDTADTTLIAKVLRHLGPCIIISRQEKNRVDDDVPHLEVVDLLISHGCQISPEQVSLLFYAPFVGKLKLQKIMRQLNITNIMNDTNIHQCVKAAFIGGNHNALDEVINLFTACNIKVNWRDVVNTLISVADRYVHSKNELADLVDMFFPGSSQTSRFRRPPSTTSCYCIYGGCYGGGGGRRNGLVSICDGCT